MNSVSRVLPAVEEPTQFFWTAGSQGQLRVLRCQECRYFIHPPVPFCPRCESRATVPEAVSGRGTIYSFTVNHHSWDGSGDVYVIALVALDEQPDVRLMTNIVNVDPASVRIGMAVEVEFEVHGSVHLPLFRPVAR